MKNVVVLSDEQRESVQNYAFKALCEFDRICKKNNIRYSLGYGTLIGAIRHKGFIPWDDDIDVCVSRKDVIKLRKIANSELAEGFFYQSHESENDWYRLYDKIRVDGTLFREVAHENEKIHQGVYIDIFALDYVSHSKIVDLFQSAIYKFITSILSAKFISIRQKHGPKKYISILFRIIFFFVKKKWLYVLAERISTLYKSGDMLKCFETPYNDNMPESDFDNFVRVDFMNRPFMVVEKYDWWLRKIYGNYMQLPPVEKRVTRHTLSELKL